MSERAREPLEFEDLEEEPEPEPATGSAGSGGALTAVGGGLEDDEGGDEPPIVITGRRGGPDEGPSRGGPIEEGIQLTPEKYGMPIEDLNLSMRGYNCLRRSGLITLGQLLQRSEEEFLALRNFGRKSYDEMRDVLDLLGILPMEPVADLFEAPPEEPGAV